MQISRHISPLRTLAQIVFVALPTIAIIYFLLWNITDYFTILKNTHLRNTVYVGAGILCSMFYLTINFHLEPHATIGISVIEMSVNLLYV
jgi:hypothetical protein